jgi:hypothetical protein
MSGAHAVSVAHPIAAAMGRILLLQFALTASPRQGSTLKICKKDAWK